MVTAGIHERFMQRCLDLAISGMGNVAPNPMVGCVIVHQGKIIGEGYHRKFGGAHAEVNAVNSVSGQHLLKDSTLYVNLEPCSHFGKTPPCANLILQKGIPRVVTGSFDPNPEVSGKGIAILRSAGVEVVTDVVKPECDFLNRRFLTFHTKKRPYIILKWAQSADGFMAPDKPQQFWLTNAESKKLVHKWRTEEQAILAGTNTIAIDDSELTARLWTGRNPLRAIIDRKLSLAPGRKVFNSAAPTVVFNEITDKIENNLQYIKLNFADYVNHEMLHALYQQNIQSVIVEGGAATLESFTRYNLWDEARIFITPHLINTGKAAPLVSGKLLQESETEGDKLKILVNTGA